MDAVDAELNTALHHAAKQNQIEAVKVLLQAGANPNLQNSQIKKPIELVKDAELKSIMAGKTHLRQP